MWKSTTQIFLESIVYTVRNIGRLVEMNISIMCAYIISCAGISYINKVWMRYAVAHPDEYDPLLFTAAGAVLVLLNWLLFVWMFVRIARFRIIGNCVDETLHGKELQNVWKMFAAVLPVAIFILIVSGDGVPYAQAFFKIVILMPLVGGAFAIGAIFYLVLRLLIAAPAWTIGLRLHGPGEIWRFAGA
ncbi:MAG: hypothetical protein R3D02_05310, partial [Hyphomicrobiales bacterium]